MSEAIAIAASGLKSESYLIDTIANDLANLNTPSYKSSTLRFEDMVYDTIQSSTSLLTNQVSIKIGLGSAVIKSDKDFSPGPMKPSAKWSDVAINGEGFYQVLTQEGNIAYSRNASLTVDSERYLCTQDGMRLADNIQIPEDYEKISFKANGDVEAILPDDTEPQLLGAIRLAKFINPESLNPIGSGVYTLIDDIAEPIVDQPGNSGLGGLAQYQLEGSNVDMVTSLMQLTLAQRIYQLNAKAVQVADELEKLTNELRG